MSTLLIDRARCIATADHDDPASGTEWRDASLFVRDGLIEWIGRDVDLPPALQTADEVLTLLQELLAQRPDDVVVLSGGADNEVVRIQQLRKIYPANSRAGGIDLFGGFRWAWRRVVSLCGDGGGSGGGTSGSSSTTTARNSSNDLSNVDNSVLQMRALEAVKQRYTNSNPTNNTNTINNTNTNNSHTTTPVPVPGSATTSPRTGTTTVPPIPAGSAFDIYSNTYSLPNRTASSAGTGAGTSAGTATNASGGATEGVKQFSSGKCMEFFSVLLVQCTYFLENAA